MPKDVIIALDFATKELTVDFLKKFSNLEDKPYVKVGMELYYKEGIEFVKYLKQQGFKIFLDLKLFDIPQTVYKAIYNIVSNVEVEIINVHALGGKQMMLSAKQAIIDAKANTKLIAVTLLTSMNVEQLNEDFGIELSFYELWNNLVQLTHNSTLDGVVCSALDLNQLKQTPQNFEFVTPGVRFADDNNNDQQRVVTPKIAHDLNSTYIVVGRPITQGENPLQKYQQFKQQFLNPTTQKQD